MGILSVFKKKGTVEAPTPPPAPEPVVSELPTTRPSSEPAPNPYHTIHQALVAKIREGRGLYLPDAGRECWVRQQQWQADVVQLLALDGSGRWMPEIEELSLLGDREYEAPPHRTLWPATIVSRQIRNLEAFAWRLHRQEII